MTAVALLCVLAPACATRTQGRVVPTPARGKYGSGLKTGDDRSGIDLGPRGGSGQSVDIPGDGGSSAGGSAGSRAPIGSGIDDHDRLGLNTHLYLSADVPKLIVEVDAQKGFAPSSGALSLLRARLASVADKPKGIDVLPVETFDDDRAPWTQADLYAVEQRNRDHWSTREAVVLYMLCVDGEFADNSDALGIAIDSSTVVLFEQTIQSAASPLISAGAIERAVAVHEMGHVLALVNIGYRSPRPHEDAAHKGHSDNPGSVMYWAVDNVGVANLLGGRTSPPTDFDADDRADLNDLKSGKLHVE